MPDGLLWNGQKLLLYTLPRIYQGLQEEDGKEPKWWKSATQELCAEYNGCEAAVKRRSHARQRAAAAFDLAYRKHRDLSPPSVTSVEYAALVDAAATDIERELRSTHTVQVHPGRKADRGQEPGWLKSTDWAVGDVETRRGLVRAAAVGRVELHFGGHRCRCCHGGLDASCRCGFARRYSSSTRHVRVATGTP